MHLVIRMNDVRAKVLAAALGIWLFISTFVWPHDAAQLTNAWVTGLLIAGFGVLSIRVEHARYGCTLLAVWLFFSNWLLHTSSEPTAWNNIIVSVSVFVASMTDRLERMEPRPIAQA